MSFQHPAWLLLAIPVATLFFWRPLPGVWLRRLRAVQLTLLVLALAVPSLDWPGQAGTSVVVVDRSQSMPAGSEAAQTEAIRALQSSMGPEHRLAVVSFGRKAVVEQLPQQGAFAGFTAEVGRTGSNLGDALERALSLIPQGAPGRILVLSDGWTTGLEPQEAALQAAARGIAIDVRPMQRNSTGDLAIASLESPSTVAPGQTFFLTGWISSPIAQEIQVELRRGTQVLASGKKQVPAGLSRLSFRDSAQVPGTLSYSLRVRGTEADPLPENDSARVLVGVDGPKPLLLVSGVENSGLGPLLQAGGLNLVRAPAGPVSFTLESLASYSAVLLENVPAERIGTAGLESLAAWVRETGTGLMMTGGRNSYGQGGYFKSPLEPILPVSMELRQEHRKLAVAIVIAMDRSGSMTAEAGAGKTKMDLANLAAVQVLDLLGPMDQLGVLAVDTEAHVMAPLGGLEDKSALRNRILRIESMGGGIYVFEALSKATSMLLPAASPTRHILLLADASDAEEPGAYQMLLEECRARNMTVSVVGLGSPSDSDAKLLEDVATRGGGRIFFSTDARDLPRLFAQDTFVVARNTFIDEPVPIQTAAGLLALTGRGFNGMPLAGGYNLCYLRPDASLGAVTQDEYKAPFVASWQAGAGRALAYTGEVDGKFTGPMAGWSDYGTFLGSLVRWTAGAAQPLPGTMSLTQERVQGEVRIVLELDPQAAPELLQTLPQVSTLRQRPGQAPEQSASVLTWTSPGTLEATIPLEGDETSLSAVEVPGYGRIALPPVCLPYSPEFRPAASEEGLGRLESLAKTTGGVHRIEIPGLWKDLPVRPRAISLVPALLLLAALLLLLEVFERRTGWITRRPARAALRPEAEPASEPQPARTKQSTPRKPAQKPAPAQSAPPAKPTPEPQPAPKPSMLSALEAAKKKASRRTEK